MSDIKKIKIKTPGGRIVIREKKRRPKAALCARCKKPLSGVVRDIPSKIKKLSKTERRPSRIYGGYLCLDCTKELLRERARVI